MMALAACTRPAEAPGVLIFAAASLQTVLTELEPGIESRIGLPVRISYAASSALARQIDGGAPADLFISADLDWMDFLEARGRIQPGTRVNLAGNRLVLIAPAGQAPALAIAPGFALAKALGDGRLAVADPAAVPAGKYAQAALTSLGVWADVADRLAPAENVRAALLIVARREAPLGIVYRSDAVAEPRVTTVGTFPSETHPPVVYPAAVVASSSSRLAAADVLQFLQEAEAGRTFEAWGFE
jgi:molybdate transport system substrate-binding protein